MHPMNFSTPQPRQTRPATQNLPRRVLILGGTGFVGRHVCAQLNRLNIHATVVTRRTSSLAAKRIQVLPYVDTVHANVFDPVELQRVMRHHDTILNLVAVLHASDSEFELIHEKLPAQIANACLQQGVQHLIHVSALGAHQSAPSQYLRSKGRGEQALLSVAHAKGLSLTLVRPSVIFGLDDAFINVFARLQKVFPCVPLASANAVFQPLWVQDVASALSFCMLHKENTQHKTFEIGGPQVLTLKELVQFAGRWCQHPRPIIPLSPFLSFVQAWLMEKAPGPTLMSRDNVLSMRVDNVLSHQLPGLESLGVPHPQSLHSVFGVPSHTDT
jgi:uncharacterized protein YbjT (DUF2867 family)